MAVEGERSNRIALRATGVYRPLELSGRTHSHDRRQNPIEVLFHLKSLFMSKAVKVIRFHKTGGPEVLKIEEAQLSRPSATEVLVRVQALTISRPDLLWRGGSYFEDPALPAQIGYDAAGVIESVGSEVKSLKVGDLVSTFPAASLLDYTAHAESIIYPETALLAYPQSITPVQAAAVNTGLFTAYF